MSRILIFVPKKIYYSVKVHCEKHEFRELIFELMNDRLVPSMFVREESNLYRGAYDNCCGNLEDSLEHFTLEKNEIEDFITTQKENFIVITDKVE